jgi:DNA-binding PadR family transcriptional regulator
MHYEYMHSDSNGDPMPPTRQPLDEPPLQPNVLLILAALGEGAAHGYRIRQEVLRRSDQKARLDPGTLYRLIARLLDEGLIDDVAAPRGADRGDERRKYYALTAHGHRVLGAEIARLEALVESVRARETRRRPRHA